MSRLLARIWGQSGNAASAAMGNHPFGNAETPMSMPMVHVYFPPQGGAMVQQVVPAPVPASTPSGAPAAQNPPLVTWRGIPSLETGNVGSIAQAGRP